MATRKRTKESLKKSLKGSKQRLVHGYKLVRRKRKPARRKKSEWFG